MAGVAAVASIFGTMMSVHAADKARSAANEQARQEKKMAAQEAAAIEAETAESVRRAKDQAAKAEGESRARAGASGLKLDGSLNLVLDDITDEHARQIDWMAKSGASQARMALLGGEMRSNAAKNQADQFQAQMWGSAFSGAASAYSAGSTTGSNWWTS